MDSFDFSVIITTLNRQNEVHRLIGEIKSVVGGFSIEILVVNSGDKIGLEDSVENQNGISLVEILTSRKNQPYQRYLGALKANGRICVFFDDDLRIIKDSFFYDIYKCYDDNTVVGTGVGFFNEGDNYVKAGSYNNSWDKFKSNINYLEFNRKSGDCGIAGREPLDMRSGAEYVNMLAGGNVPSCLRSLTPLLWDEYIFRLADNGMGKGEDKYFTLSLSAFGKIKYLNEAYIMHPRSQSTYTYSYKRWRAEAIRTRFMICDKYSIIYKQSLYLNRTRIVLGYLLAGIFFYELSRIGLKKRFYLSYSLIYSIRNTWFFTHF